MIEKKPTNGKHSLHYTRQGEGTPVVLVHGFAASNFDWTYLAPELVKNGYQVLAPDLIGHGNSIHSIPKSGYTFRVLYEHFTEWINNQEFSQEITLIGHSLGGLITLNYAIQNPSSVRKLILINPYYDKNQLNPVLRYISGNPGPYRKALQIAPSWLIHIVISLDIRGLVHYEDRARKQKAKDITRAAPEIVYIPGSIPYFSSQLSDIHLLTCVIWGTKDPTLNPNSFPALVDALPNATGIPIRGTGHQPHLARSDQLNRIVLDYLAQQSSP